MRRNVLGLDIGGANLKAAHTSGVARLVPFALWKTPALLPAALRDLVGSMPPAACLAVTMTGELCDCFETKRDGVHAILDALPQHPTTLIWRTDGQFVSLTEARRTPLLAAAANWLALACWAGRLAPSGSALLLDIGSTTTDVIPLWNGVPNLVGRTDAERLRSGELVYTGVRRTPVCALLQEGVAAEFFATMHDVFLLRGVVAEAADDCDTADGRPATRAAAHARLARMLGGDRETCSEAQTRKLADQAAARQCMLIESALKEVAARSESPEVVVTAGSGEFLAQSIVARWSPANPPALRSLAAMLGPAVSGAACAYAAAVLAAEEITD